MLVDANILLYVVDEDSRFHAPELRWLETALNGEQGVGIPLSSLTAFMRIATHPRALANPSAAGDGLGLVGPDGWPMT